MVSTGSYRLLRSLSVTSGLLYSLRSLRVPVGHQWSPLVPTVSWVPCQTPVVSIGPYGLLGCLSVTQWSQQALSILTGHYRSPVVPAVSVSPNRSPQVSTGPCSLCQSQQVTTGLHWSLQSLSVPTCHHESRLQSPTSPQWLKYRFPMVPQLPWSPQISRSPMVSAVPTGHHRSPLDSIVYRSGQQWTSLQFLYRSPVVVYGSGY